MLLQRVYGLKNVLCSILHLDESNPGKASSIAGVGAQCPRTSEQKGSYAFTHPFVRSRGYEQKEGQGGGRGSPKSGLGLQPEAYTGEEMPGSGGPECGTGDPACSTHVLVSQIGFKSRGEASCLGTGSGCSQA